MTAPEISVIIPACAAEATLPRAVSSVLASRDVRVEAIVVANDEADYEAALRLGREQAARVRFLRTPAPRSGPSSARNMGMAHAQSELLAFLDADDFFALDRLALLRPLAREHGAATGPCVPVSEGPGATDALGAAPVGEAAAAGSLSLRTILTSRRSFSPVLDRRYAGEWRAARFAEDMIFNAELEGRAPRYAYLPEALYGYVQTPQSGSRGPGSLRRALQGYGDILAQLFDLDLSDEAKTALFRQLRRDIEDSGAALFENQARGWGEAVAGRENAP